MSPSSISPDTRAVVRAAEALTTQVRRIADALSTPVVEYAVATDDAPTTPPTTRLHSISTHSVQGFCPACGHGVLMLGDGGHVVCTLIDCPDPDAVDKLLTRTDDDAPDDACRAVDIGGEVIRVHGGPGEMSEQSKAALAEVIQVAERRLLAEEDEQRTARRDSAGVLLARAERMRLSVEEVSLLRQHFADEAREVDTARAVAAGNKRHVQTIVPELDDLQTRITKARALHASHASGSAECLQRCERLHPSTRVCNECESVAPCRTAQALDGGEQPTTEAAPKLPRLGTTETP